MCLTLKEVIQHVAFHQPLTDLQDLNASPNMKGQSQESALLRVSPKITQKMQTLKGNSESQPSVNQPQDFIKEQPQSH